jgi:hypothetical protein
MAATPECPECGAEHEAAPDVFGVYGCSDCGVLFRPPVRVPIRRAGSSEVAAPNNNASWIVAAVIGIGAAVAIILGDSRAPADPPSLPYPPIQIEVPVFDPNTLGPPAPIALEREVHLSRVVDGRLQATGIVRNPDARELLSVALELRFTDVAGATVRTHAATVACRRIAADSTCGWAVDAPLPAGMVDFELNASAQPNWIGDVFEPLELRREFDAAGRPHESGDELELDLHEHTVRVRVPDDVRLFDAWATLTCLDEAGQVMDVLETRWAESLSGQTVLPIALPQHRPSRFELRVGGTAMPNDLALPMPLPK